MNVLSLFDGMSCGQIALGRADIKVDNYYASEIDKYAIQVTQKNYPNTVQLGDVTKVNAKDLPKIDLLIGGSPCQGFSFAGKQLNFEDPRSKLFFEFVRILNEIKEINPNVKFLLENVKMKKEYQDIISEHLGVKPVVINSALVSAQNRIRLYWSNITDINQPENKKIYLKDILEPIVAEKYYISKIAIEKLNRHNNKIIRQVEISDKSGTIHAGYYKMGGRDQQYVKDNPICVDSKGDRNESRIRKLTPIECERLQTVPDNYTEIVSNTQRYKMLGNGWTVDVIAHIFQGLKK
jgi:DNA-cytosine methyltransferase